MAKPPSSTRTIRLPDELWAAIKADAEAREETVNGVIARHLRVAYRSGPIKVQDVVDVTVANLHPAAPKRAFAMERVSTAKPMTFLQYGRTPTKPGERFKTGKKK